MRYFRPHLRPTVFIFFLFVVSLSFVNCISLFWPPNHSLLKSSHTQNGLQSCHLPSSKLACIYYENVFCVFDTKQHVLLNYKSMSESKILFCWTILPHTMRVNNNNSLSFNWSEPTSTDFFVCLPYQNWNSQMLFSFLLCSMVLNFNILVSTNCSKFTPIWFCYTSKALLSFNIFTNLKGFQCWVKDW